MNIEAALKHPYDEDTEGNRLRRYRTAPTGQDPDTQTDTQGNRLARYRTAPTDKAAVADDTQGNLISRWR